MNTERRRRVAWFTPLPPVRSGISAYSVELLPLLVERFDIDVYIDMSIADSAGGVGSASPTTATIRSAHDFVWKNRGAPYDAVVYQIGNAGCHDYMWPYLTRHPGLVVLHDGQLHHARAGRLLHERRFAEYRAEFGWSEPQAPASLAEYAVAGFGGPSFYLWPMLRLAAVSARMLAAHSEGLVRELQERFPETSARVIPMGVTDPLAVSRDGTEIARSIRARHGIPQDAVLFAAYGIVTPEKRVPQLLRALAWLTGLGVQAHLLLVGKGATHYDAAEDADDVGVADAVTITGYVADEDLPEYLMAADVCLSLRWPTSRETSASLLRCLAAAKPTVATDLAHTVDTPALDPRTWTTIHAGHGQPPDPVAVKIDILDEDHSLRLAMYRLAGDPDLRARLGAAARAWWRARHTLDAMAGAYVAALESITDTPLVGARAHAAGMPAHLVEDGTTHARKMLARFGIPLHLLGM